MGAWATGPLCLVAKLFSERFQIEYVDSIFLRNILTIQYFQQKIFYLLS